MEKGHRRARNRARQREGFFMYISDESLLVILFVGLVAGWLAGKVVRGTGFGIIGDIIVGVAGAFFASWLFPKFHIQINGGLVSEIIYSAIGAALLLLIVRLIRTGGRL
jgi:uncharacterized membrane protein YeaQ/YmgE (transglycosylase-associated protein family)